MNKQMNEEEGNKINSRNNERKMNTYNADTKDLND